MNNFFYISFFLGSVLTFAQAPVNDEKLELKLEDISKHVIANLSEIRNSELRIEQSEINKELRLSNFKTQGNIQAGYDNLVDGDNSMAFGFQLDEDERISSSFQVSQYLYGFGRKKWATEQGMAEINLSRLQNSMMIRDLTFKARINFWTHIFEKAGLNIAKERLKLAEEEESDTESLFEAGTLSKVDVLQTRVSKMQAKNTTKSQSSRLKKSMHELASSIGKVHAQIVSSTELTPPKNIEKLFVEVRAMLDQSLDIAIFKAESKISQTRIEQTQSEYLPELYGSASAGVVGPSTDDLEEGWLLGLTLNWAILDGKQRDNKALFETKNILANDFSIKAEIRERNRIYQQLWADWESLTEQISNERDALEYAEENYEIAREQYRAGLLTLLQVSDVNLQLVESRFRLLSIIYEMQILHENLLYLKQ